MQDAVILRGPIPKTGIIPLVQAMGIGRQTNIVELHDVPDHRVGQLTIRSGKLLSVEYAGREGIGALADFVTLRDGSFIVRSVHGAPATEPLGDLRTLLTNLGGAFAQVSLIRNLETPAPAVLGTGVQASPQAIVPATPAYVPPAYVGPTYAAPPAPVAPAVAATPAPVAPAPVFVAAPVVAPPAPVVAPPAPVVAPPAPVVAPPATPTPEPATPPKRLSVVPAPKHAAPIVAVVSAKGGSGKTTLTMNLAVALARRGLRVTIVDTDPNGGVSASVSAHKRIVSGAFDVICGATTLADVTVTTRMPGLRVVPAGGSTLSIDQLENAQSHRVAWRALLGSIASGTDIVILDTAGGVYGPIRTMLGLATHVLGVLQAEPLALRASDHFDRVIASLSPAPTLVGIAMNMFEPRGQTASAVLQDACNTLRPGLLFDTAIPRTPIINEASLRGVIAGQGELSNAPAVAWTFEQLAAELLDRLELTRPQSVLEDTPLF
jgi:chromosome partitioning protein